MSGFRIFTESKADVKFIIDYLDELFGIRFSFNDFDTLGSWSGYKTGGELIDAIRQNHLNGQQTILILDADSDFNGRQSEVTNDFQNDNISIHLFLFPNNSKPGNLENLLCEIAVERKLIQCFEAYESCIQGYESPVIKSKVFAYLDAMLPAKNKRNNRHDFLQEVNRNYRNPAHWNLRHEYLQPLRQFLAPFFVK